MKKSILFVLLLLFIPLAQAEPPVTGYWGYVTLDGSKLSNASVTVIGSSGTTASATSNLDATYLVIVPWTVSGESLTFKVNGVTATTTTIGDKGANIPLNLAASSSGGSSSGGGSGGGTYSPGYTTTGTAKATATAVKTATATPVVVQTEVPVATTAKPEATVTTKEPASEPTTPGFGAIIAVFAIAMIASLLKNNRNRR